MRPIRSTVRRLFADFRHRKLVREVRRKGEEHRRAAIHINDLASRIHSEADAGELVNAVVRMFSRELPPSWTAIGAQRRLARAEHETANMSHLIAEDRVAEVWNEYVREIRATDEAIVSAAEIHDLRNASCAIAQMMWPEYQTIWTMPSVYALGSDGKVANGCRALDALRVLFEIHNLFDNVRCARERLANGIVFSNQLKLLKRNGIEKTAGAELRVRTNPIRCAEALYIREHGSQRLDQLLQRLFDQLFPD